MGGSAQGKNHGRLRGMSNRQDTFWRTLWKMVFRSIISAIALCESEINLILFNQKTWP
jgi:hypothetical protein